MGKLQAVVCSMQYGETAGCMGKLQAVVCSMCVQSHIRYTGVSYSPECVDLAVSHMLCIKKLQVVV